MVRFTKYCHFENVETWQEKAVNKSKQTNIRKIKFNFVGSKSCWPCTKRINLFFLVLLRVFVNTSPLQQFLERLRLYYKTLYHNYLPAAVSPHIIVFEGWLRKVIHRCERGKQPQQVEGRTAERWKLGYSALWANKGQSTLMAKLDPIFILEQ